MLKPELTDPARSQFRRSGRDDPFPGRDGGAALRRRRIDAVVAAAAIALVLAFQAWTALSTDPAPLFGAKRSDYNNRLMHSFIAGHLYLPYRPDPRLVAAADPYDPAKRPPGVPTIHDGSYYRGHYYLYFGVTPVVTLLLPWRLLTGHDLPQVYEVVFFTGGGFLAAALLWLSLRRRYFPESGRTALVAGLAVLGLGCMTHAVLRRSDLWEAAIAPGYCFAMLTLGCLYRSLHGTHPCRWLAAAGVSFGLAVGSRPTYVFAAAALVVPLALAWSQGGGRRDRQWRIRTLALAAGMLPIAAGLAWYNCARFGNPVEFGNHYMLNASDEHTATHFSLRYLPYNFYVYYLAPIQWSRYFPFVEMIHSPRQPRGYYGIEYICGLLVDFPFAWFAAAGPHCGWRRPAGERSLLRAFVLAAAAFYLGVAGLEAFWWAATARYMVDFAPELMLRAAIGMLALERTARGRWRTAARTLAGAGAAVSVFVGVMLSFQLHELLRVLHPKTFDAIAHACDTPVYWIERLAGTRFGAREITLRFPRGRTGAAEPLVTTGWEYYSDHLFVQYLDDRHLRFGFDHTSLGLVWSSPQKVDYAVPHVLQISMGSFYPPRPDPYFDRFGKARIETLSRGLCLTLDGRAVFDAPADFYDASPGSIAIGRDPTGSYGGRFTGRILSVRVIHAAAPPHAGYGEVEIDLSLPPGILGRYLPLVATGVPGRGDLLRLREVRPGWVRFAYDHWGVGLWQSGEVPMVEGGTYRLRIRLPALAGPEAAAEPAPFRNRLQVDVNGRTVWQQGVPYYPAPARDIFYGLNAIGATTSERRFPIGIMRIALIPTPTAEKRALPRL